MLCCAARRAPALRGAIASQRARLSEIGTIRRVAVFALCAATSMNPGRRSMSAQSSAGFPPRAIPQTQPARAGRNFCGRILKQRRQFRRREDFNRRSFLARVFPRARANQFFRQPAVIFAQTRRTSAALAGNCCNCAEKAPGLKEPRHIIRHECAYVAMKRLRKNAKPVAQVGKINLAHAFRRSSPRSFPPPPQRRLLRFDSAAMMPRVEARCIHQGHAIKKLSGLACIRSRRHPEADQILYCVQRAPVNEPVAAGKLHRVHVAARELRRFRFRFVRRSLKVAKVQPVAFAAQVVCDAVISALLACDHGKFSRRTSRV